MDFFDRSTRDHMLLAWVTGVQRTMPTVTVERAIERFVKEFGRLCEDCTVASLQSRYQRIKEDYDELAKSKGQ